MLQATITVQFGINCTATSSNSGLIALLRVVIITHYNACYVISKLILEGQFLNQARAGLWPACTWFLDIDLVRKVCVCVCLCVRP